MALLLLREASEIKKKHRLWRKTAAAADDDDDDGNTDRRIIFTKMGSCCGEDGNDGLVWYLDLDFGFGFEFGKKLTEKILANSASPIYYSYLSSVSCQAVVCLSFAFRSGSGSWMEDGVEFLLHLHV